MSIKLEGMITEKRNPLSENLDTMSALEIVTLMNNEDKKVAFSITPRLSAIAKTVEKVVETFKRGGRLFYIGAGTSGRLAVVDASECPPTFGVSSDMVIAIIAGGDKAFVKAVEGAEDSKEEGREDLKKNNLSKCDMVIGVAASGRTPYVIGGLEYAKELGCSTSCICCNTNSEIGKIVDIKIEVNVGEEIITGSTRLKSGTSQKMILNMISTSSMVLMGKCYKNYMVDVVQSNEKLNVRAQNIVMEITGVDREKAIRVLKEADGSVKKSIVMILLSCSKSEASLRLERSNGRVRDALRE